MKKEQFSVPYHDHESKFVIGSDGIVQMVEIEEDGKKVQRAEVNPALCTGCGACVAVCPENAINVKGWTLKQYEAMVDMIVSEEVAA